MVESSECWLLIGREVPQKIFKGGTLTILIERIRFGLRDAPGGIRFGLSDAPAGIRSGLSDAPDGIRSG